LVSHLRFDLKGTDSAHFALWSFSSYPADQKKMLKKRQEIYSNFLVGCEILTTVFVWVGDSAKCKWDRNSMGKTFIGNL
jgi:hypothetical protein